MRSRVVTARGSAAQSPRELERQKINAAQLQRAMQQRVAMQRRVARSRIFAEERAQKS
jgi:hypothetical protein